jgi:hypothetical protein
MDMSRHPSALRSEATEAPTLSHSASPQETPALASSPSRVAGDRVLRQAQDERGGDATPNLPALITALPGPGSGSGAGYTRAPQTEFTRARQVLFL